jgi:hypothetical protein
MAAECEMSEIAVRRETSESFLPVNKRTGFCEAKLGSNSLICKYLTVVVVITLSCGSIKISDERWIQPVPVASTQNFQMLYVLLWAFFYPVLYYQYLKNVRECVQRLLGNKLEGDHLIQDDIWNKAEEEFRLRARTTKIFTTGAALLGFSAIIILSKGFDLSAYTHWVGLLLFAGGMILGTCMTYLLNRLLRNIGLNIIRREHDGTPTYVNGKLSELIIALCAQIILSTITAIIDFGSPWVVTWSHNGSSAAEVAQDGSGGWSGCTPPPRYIQTYCNYTTSLKTAYDDMQTFGSLVLSCDDGGYGYFVSRFDACSANLGYWQLLRLWATAWACLYLTLFVVLREFILSVEQETQTISKLVAKAKPCSSSIGLGIWFTLLGTSTVLLLPAFTLFPSTHGIIAFNFVVQGFGGICFFGAGFAFMYAFEQHKVGYTKDDIKIKINGPGNELVSLKKELTKLTNDRLVGARSGNLCGDVKDLVSGKPVDAPRGLEFRMKCPRTFAMPPPENGVKAIEDEFMKNGNDVDNECLNYVLNERAGSSDKKFVNGNLKRDCDEDGVVLDERLTNEGVHMRKNGSTEPLAANYGMKLDDFLNHQSSKTAILDRAEVLALRLYTTAAFSSLNTPLRDRDKERRPHPFPITVTFLTRAIGKLRSVEAANCDQGEVDLWRGMKNLKVGVDWAKSGGTEYAPMSTTTDLRVAVQYSMSPSSLLFKIKTTSFMQRGADLQYLSAFPAERELLYAPLTFLKPTGRCMDFSTGPGGSYKYKVVEVTPTWGVTS